MQESFVRWWERQGVELQRDSQLAARRILAELNRLDASERKVFLGEALHVLVGQTQSFGTTLFLLEGLEDPAVLDHVATHLHPLPAQVSADEEAQLADLIRLLAVTQTESALAVVRSFLLHRPIGVAWESVPWSLWNSQPELFAEAWTRFFVERPPKRWKDGDVVRSFLAEPDAIEVLRDRFGASKPRRWQAFRRSILRLSEQEDWIDPSHKQRIIELLQ